MSTCYMSIHRIGFLIQMLPLPPCVIASQTYIGTTILKLINIKHSPIYISDPIHILAYFV